MKRTILIIISILCTTFLSAQSKLDEKRGFKDIRIGDKLDKWENSLSNKQIQGNQERYLFNNTCCNRMFSYDISEIYLVFENRELKRIQIYSDWFKDSGVWGDTEFTDIKENLEAVFGEATGLFEPKDEEGVFIWYWNGKEIYLQSRYDWQGSFSPSRVVIDIVDKKHLEKLTNSGF